MAIGKIVQEIALKITGVDEAKKLDDQIKDLEKKKHEIKVSVDADTAEADRKLDEIDHEVDRLNKERARVEVDADTASADRKLDEIDRELDALKRERAKVEVDADTSDADRKLKEVDRQLDALRRQKTKIDIDADTTPATGSLGNLKKVGGDALTFLKDNAAGFALGAGAAIGTFAAKAIGEFQDLALESGKLSDTLGLTTEDASRWVEVAGDVGVEAGAVEATFGKLMQTIGKAPKAFERMGIEIARSADGAVDVNETILNVIDHLNKIEDPTQRAAEAQKLLGKSWKDSAELIAAGEDVLRESLAAVSDAKIIDEGEVEQARQFRDTMDDLADSGEELSIALGQTLGPMIASLAGSLTVLINGLERANELSGGKLAEFGRVSVPGGAFRDIDKGAAGALRTLTEKGWAVADAQLITLAGDTEAYAAEVADADADVQEFIKSHKPMSAMPEEWEMAADAVKRMRQGLAPTVEQMAAIGRITAETGKSTKQVFADAGAEIDKNKPKIADFANGMLGMAAQTQVANAAAREFNETIASTDFAATGLQGGIAGMTAFSDQFFSLQSIAADTEAAFDNLDDSLEKNGFTFDLNSDKGRANQKAMEDLARSMDGQLAAAFDASAGSFAEFDSKARTIAGTLRDRLIHEMGLSEQQADELIAKLGLMPKDVETRYKLSGTEEAKLQLQLLQGTIDRLDKNVQGVVDFKISMGDYVGAVQTVQNYMSRHPVTIPVELRVTTANLTAAQQAAINAGRGSANGTNSMPPGGGIAGEAGGEFVRLPDGTWGYVERPTWLPPRTKVISVRRSRSIMRGRSRGPTGRGTGGGDGLPRYAGGTGGFLTVPGSTVVHNHTHVNAAVIGSRYDVAKAVGQGNRDLVRLLGKRGTGVR